MGCWSLAIEGASVEESELAVVAQVRVHGFCEGLPGRKTGTLLNPKPRNRSEDPYTLNPKRPKPYTLNPHEYLVRRGACRTPLVPLPLGTWTQNVSGLRSLEGSGFRVLGHRV